MYGSRIRAIKALKDLFQSNNYSRTRPHRYSSQPAYDFIREARQEGATFMQDFHDKITVRGGNLYSIIADICAFANSNGGTLYLGLSADPERFLRASPVPIRVLRSSRLRSTRESVQS